MSYIKNLDEFKDELLKEIEDLSAQNKVALWNEYCDAANYSDNKIFHITDINDYLKDKTPLEIAEMLKGREDMDYWWFNGYGKVEFVEIDDTVDWDTVIDYAIEDGWDFKRTLFEGRVSGKIEESEDELKEELENWIYGLSDDELISVWNEYAENNGENEVYYYNEIDELYDDRTPTEILYIFEDSGITSNTSYWRYDNFETPEGIDTDDLEWDDVIESIMDGHEYGDRDCARKLSYIMCDYDEI